MRTLTRNQQTFWWAKCTGTVNQTDADGNYTGVRVPKYGTVHKSHGNISGSTNTVNSYYKDMVHVVPFGVQSTLEKVIVFADPDEGIDATSVVWIGVDPTEGTTQPPYNYVVKNITRSLNNLTVAVHEVTSSGTSPS